jgi:predicted LPLAT superfamily acyltransferase
MIDKVASLCGLNHYFSYVFEGEDNLKEIIDGQKGGILIGGHIGNWEISSHRLNRFKGKINLLMLDAEHRKLSSLLSGIKVHYPENVNMIVVKDDLSHIYEVSMALQNNEIVCIHGDRFMKDSKTEKISFMGKDALFSSGPFILAAKFKVPVCYFYGMKESKRKYHLYAFLSSVDISKYSKTLPSELLKEYASYLEQITRKYPDQWFNYYKFWGEEVS